VPQRVHAARPVQQPGTQIKSGVGGALGASTSMAAGGVGKYSIDCSGCASIGFQNR